MVPMVHSQDGHEGLTPRRCEPQIMKQESLQPSAPQSEQTGRKLKPQRLTVINTSQRKLLERVPLCFRGAESRMLGSVYL